MTSSESLCPRDFLTAGGGGGHLALVRLGDLSSPVLALSIVARMGYSANFC